MPIEDIKEPSEEEVKKQKEQQEKLVQEAKKKIEDANNSTQKIRENLIQNMNKTPIQVLNPSNGWQKTAKDRFEIELYDEITDDETGDIKGYKKVPSEHPIIIEASTKAELQEHANRYQYCHQRMKIIRKLPDGNQLQNVQQTHAQPSNQSVQTQPFQQSQPVQPSQVKEQDTQSQVQPPQAKAIRYYKIGDIEIKDDNGTLYQKQWMKLVESEAMNVRLVNDKTNSIVNITGKHFEMKKWILIENECDSMESNLR